MQLTYILFYVLFCIKRIITEDEVVDSETVIGLLTSTSRYNVPRRINSYAMQTLIVSASGTLRFIESTGAPRGRLTRRINCSNPQSNRIIFLCISKNYIHLHTMNVALELYQMNGRVQYE